MPHLRQRHILPVLLKKLLFSPVIAIQGARQTGKSVLARDILPHKKPSFVYVTFDEFAQREFARRNPDTYLSQYPRKGTLAIDEAQKVPDVFDAVKWRVDRNRVPGSYLLLGSTEFNRLSRVRESLTGRMSRVRLYPMNLAETLRFPPNPSRHQALLCEKTRVERRDVMSYLECGGFPGIFAVRSSAERHALLQDWIDLTTQRDVLQFPGLNIEPDLCLEILRAVAVLEHPDAANIARTLKRDGRRVRTHIKVLKTLFVLNELLPHRQSTGKPVYYLLDAALARFFGADFGRQLATWFLNEQLSQRSCRDDRATMLRYFRTAKGSIIHFIIESDAAIIPVKILDSEKMDGRDLMILESFRERSTGKRVECMALGAQRFSLKKERIEIYPWESAA